LFAPVRAAASVIVTACDIVDPGLSVTASVTVVVPPDPVGMPLIVPVVAFNVSPAGSIPCVNVHVYGVVPPVAVCRKRNGKPISPLAVAPEVIVSGPITASVKALVAVNGVVDESVAWIVKLDVPVAVGVPASTPALVRVSPAGKLPEATTYLTGDVPPVVANVAEYAVFKLADGSGDAVVITRAVSRLIVKVTDRLDTATEVAVTVAVVTAVGLADAV
jgi:hypothetical protein